VVKENLRFSILSVLGLATLMSVAVGARAQDTPSSDPAPSGDVKPAGRTGAAGIIQASGSPDDVPTNGAAPPIQELGRGGWLSTAASPLHWGWLSIGSFNFVQGYDNFSGGSPGALQGVVHSSVFGTQVILNPRFSRTNIAFQWRPQAGVIGGKFADNLNNQDVSFDLTTSVTPRFTIRFQDHFSYLPAQNIFSEGFLYAAESINNHSVQTSFLDGPGIWLTDTATVSFGYGLSPLTTITVSPRYNYAHVIDNSSAASGSVTPAQLGLIGSKEYGGSVSINHRLSPMKSVGMYYSANDVRFDNATDNAWYHIFGGTYSQQLRPSLFANITAGAATASFNNSGSRGWTFSGTADIEKTIHVGTLALAYTRGLSLNRYASRNFTDRVDVNYHTLLTRRSSTALGFGYEHVNGTPSLSGKYASAQLGYRLLRNLNFLMTYVFRDQIGDGLQAYTDTRHTAYVSLNWDPLHMR